MSSVVEPFSITRAELPDGGNLCEYCTAKCCRYFALPIDTPKTWREFDFIRWYMIHGRVSVFVDDGAWFVMVHADCRHLQSDHRCGIYETRPEICREYTTAGCEYDPDGAHDQLFETPDQIWEYAEAILGTRERTRARETLGLPVIAV
ncbi:MAG: YkgJ family cysteine cluster protein [Planctomycetota bacterium]